MWYVILLAVLKQATGQACYQGWVNERDSCYRAIYTPLSWKHASALCESMTAKLVTLNDLTEQTRILELRPEHLHQLFWIGYHKQAHIWRWSDTTNSSINHLVINNNAGRCAAIDKKGEWLPASCDKKLPFFCEIEAFDCPVGDGWVDVGPQCLLVVKTPRSWYEARDNCRRLKSQLAILSGQNPTLVDHFSKKDMAWAGLVYDSVNGQFVWNENSDDNPYLHATSKLTRRCGVVRRNSTEQLEIRNMSCSAKLMSVCEKALLQDLSYATSQSATPRLAVTIRPPGLTNRISGVSHIVVMHRATSTIPSRENSMNMLPGNSFISGSVATQTANYDTWIFKILECFEVNNSAIREDCVSDTLQSADPFSDDIVWPSLGNKKVNLAPSKAEYILKVKQTQCAVNGQ